MAQGTTPKSYAKNVLRSAGYISAETIKGINPTLTSFISDTASYSKEMYSNVRDFKSILKQKITDVGGNKAWDELKNTKGNILDDLKTGKFYNKERQDQAQEAWMKANGFDFDFDFDEFNNDLNSEADSASESSVVTKESVQAAASTIALSAEQISNMSTDRITKSAKINTKVSLAHNQRMFGMVNNSLAAINSSILNLHQDLATPLNTHIVNSTNFYTTATQELAKQTSYLEKINNILIGRYGEDGKGAGKGAAKAKTSAWDEIFGIAGLPDVNAFGKTIKQRAIDKTIAGELSTFLNPEMLELMSGSGMFSSPIALIATTVLSSKIASGPTGKALDRLVDSMRGGFMSMASRIHDYNKKGKGGIKGWLADLFDITPDYKNDLKKSFGNYNKGNAVWTGKDSKALREVIPTQLSTIISLLSGKEARVYDYETGTFKSASKVEAEFNEKRTRNFGSGASSLRRNTLESIVNDYNRAAIPGTESYAMGSKGITKSLGDEFDRMMQILAMEGANASQFTSANDLINYLRPHYRTGELNPKNVRRLARTIFKGKTAQGQLNAAIYGARSADMRFQQSFTSDSPIAMVKNGSQLNKRFNAVGVDYQTQVLSYLHDIYSVISANKLKAARGPKGSRVRGQRTTRSRADAIRTGSEDSDSDGESDEDYLFADMFNSTNEDWDAQGAKNEWDPETETWKRSTKKTTTRADREKKFKEKSTIVSKAVDGVTAFMDDIFFGGQNEGIRKWYREKGGIPGILKGLPNSIAEATNKAKYFLKSKWDTFRKGDAWKNYVNNIKGMVSGFAKDTWSYGKDKATKFSNWFHGRVQAVNEANPEGAAAGGMVTKSGMASVSEGEMIIPAKYNPYYTGSMDDGTRHFVEKKNYRSWLNRGGNKDEFFGYYAEGAKKVKSTAQSARDSVYLTDEQIEQLKSLYNQGYTPEEIAKKLKAPLGSVNHHVNKLKRINILNESIHDAAKAARAAKNSKIGQKVTDFGQKVVGGADQFMNHLFGDSNTYKDAKSLGKEAFNVAKANLPRTMAAGTLGALAGGALTGSGLGLLGGFVVGAGIDIIKNSENISARLFGKKDPKTGEYSGGMIKNPKIVKFIKESMPEAAKAGALGGVLGAAGLAPGGILGGFVIGSGLSLVAQTNKFKDVFFGKDDGKGNRTGGILGSIQHHIVDPLIRFTRGGMNKIADFFKKQVFEPTKTFLDAGKDWVKGKAQRIVDNALEKGKTLVKRTIGERANALIKPLAGAAGKVGKAGLGAVKGVVSAPFKALGKAGEGLARHNIRAGYSSLDAADRIAKMKGTNIFGKAYDHSTIYDNWALGKGGEQIGKARRFLNGVNDINRQIQKKRQNCADVICSHLRSGGLDDPGLVKQIKKLFNTKRAIKDNDYSEVKDFISGISDAFMGPEDKDAAIKMIDQMAADIEQDRESIKTFEQDKKEWLAGEGKGLEKVFANKKLFRAARSQSRVDFNLLSEKDKVAANAVLEKARAADQEKRLLDQQKKDNPLDAERNKSIDKIADLVTQLVTFRKVEMGEDPTSALNAVQEPGASFGDDGAPIARSFRSKMLNAKLKKTGEDDKIRWGEDKNGNPIKYIKNQQGEWVPDMQDTETKDAIEANKEEQEGQRTIANVLKGIQASGLLGFMTNYFKPKDKEDKKETLLDKIKNFLSGNSFLSGIGSVLSKVITVAVPLALAAAGVGAFSIFGNKNAGTATDSGMRKGTDPEARKAEVAKMNIFQKAGLGINALQAKITGKDYTTYGPDDYVSDTATQRLGKQILKNAAIGLNPTLGKAGAKVISKIGSNGVIGKVLKSPLTASSSMYKVVDKLKGILGKIFAVIFHKNAVQATEEVITTASEVVAKETAEVMAKEAGEKLVKLFAKVGLVIYLAQIAYAVIDGMTGAKAKIILGILETPTPNQKMISGAINGLNYAIPGIGGLIPTETLVNIFYTVLSTLGFDFGNWGQQRAAAKATIAEFNELNGTTYNIEEYLAANGEYVLGTKIKKFLGESAEKVGSKISQIFSPDRRGEFNNNLDTTPDYQNTTTKKSANTFNVASGLTNADYSLDFDYVPSGGRSGIHTSQKGNYRRFGASTIDSDGCGPASAATILKAYGKDADVNSLAYYAEKGGYVGKGTKASYFSDVLGANGIQTDYLTTSTEIRRAVRSGSPTVLLGQDSSNRSKTNSPFGPGNHYVVARGMDRSGNVIVDDPEQAGTTRYNKSILNKSKLGIVTSGDSETEGTETTTEKKSFGEIFSNAFNSAFTGTAGKILQLITSGWNTSSSTSSDTSNSFMSSSDRDSVGTVIYGENPYFPILTGRPSDNDPYIYLYNNSNARNRGVSQAITGRPTDPGANVLSNCVGWACARFNHIYNLLTGYKGIMFPRLNCNAGKFIERAQEYGLQISDKPQVGAIMCWGKKNGAGHVAIVERVDSDTEVFTSESGWQVKKHVWNKTRNKGNGNWGQSNEYYFRGFIYNPAVAEYSATTLWKKSKYDTSSAYAQKYTSEDGRHLSARGSDITRLTGFSRSDYTAGDSDLFVRRGARKSVGSGSAIKATKVTTRRTQNIPIHDVTRTTTSRSTRRGGASAIPAVSAPINTGTTTSSDTKLMKEMALYMKQIAANTANNTVLPSLVQVMDQYLKNQSVRTTEARDNGLISDNFADATQREITLMQSKLETIASSF